MGIAKSHIYFLLLFFLPCQSISAQDNNLFQRTISFQFPENTFLGHVDNLLVQENIVLAFNSSRVDLSEVIKLPRKDLTLEQIIRLLFYKDNIKLTAGNDKIIITFLDKRSSEKLTIKGYITDGETGEVLVGASIVDIGSNSSTFSNEFGFYSLTISRLSNRINFHYLGYKSLLIEDIDNSSVNVDLEFDNAIDQIIIEGSISDNFLIGSGSEKIDLSQTQGFQSTSGDNDLIRAVRVSPTVQSGNEGQVGLYVRGGSPDQNLILFDGIPLYEVSHTAGFSSIFIEESIKDVDFISNGFPARYGGRLSSVMNVRLKDGNQSKFNGSAKFSLPAMKAHLEGPLFSPKTTFNISGRLSYVDKYLNQLIGDLVSYDDIELKYQDIIGKVTHRFSETQKVSFSFYDGQDVLGLVRSNSISDTTGSLFETNSDNEVKWGSTIWSGTFSNVVSDKLQLSFNVGGIKYKNESIARFEVNSTVNNLSTIQKLELISHSQIEDQLVGINLDYYLNDQHRVKFGGSWIHHNYKPALIGTDTTTNEGSIKIVSEDNLIPADELALYIEDTYRPHKNWEIYGGIHLSGFNIGEQKYRNLQPRFSTVFTLDSVNRFTVSYSNMIQYIHLLVNPGVGVPSDFWVPSTETVKPESARQFSLGYSRKINNSIELSVSGYSKSIQNVLEYETTVDLIFNIVNSITKPTIHDDPNWQNTVIPGKSTSRGLELQMRKTSGKYTGWFSYALSKTERQFELIDDNEIFPYKYDRRHDVNIGIKYKFNENCSIATTWAYGSGNAYSLADKKILAPIGEDVILITAGERNNYRFPPFSHLDVQFNYIKDIKGGELTFNLGIYNVYNRKNGYYISVYNNPVIDKFVAYKTSLFPILPNMSLGYSF